MTRLAIVATVLLLTVGCEAPPPDAQPDQLPAAAADPQKTVPAPKPDIKFADVDEAVQTLSRAAAARDSDSLIAAETWLVGQGELAAGPVGDIFRDDEAEIASRIAACRVLRRLDSHLSKEPLTAGLQSSSEQIRLNAIKGLGLIDPTDDQIIGSLAVLLDADEQRVQRETLLALGNIGPPAKDAVAERLAGILNDPSENETLRDAAKRALKEINPRRTLLD